MGEEHELSKIILEIYWSTKQKCPRKSQQHKVDVKFRATVSERKFVVDEENEEIV